jgi:hypothetical protein
MADLKQCGKTLSILLSKLQNRVNKPIRSDYKYHFSDYLVTFSKMSNRIIHIDHIGMDKHNYHSHIDICLRIYGIDGNISFEFESANLHIILANLVYNTYIRILTIILLSLLVQLNNELESLSQTST